MNFRCDDCKRPIGYHPNPKISCWIITGVQIGGEKAGKFTLCPGCKVKRYGRDEGLREFLDNMGEILFSDESQKEEKS